MYEEYVKEAMLLEEESLCEMANLTKSKLNMDVDIWSEHSGVLRINNHNQPRVRLSKNGITISVSISEDPQIIAHPTGFSINKLKREFQDGISYIARNYQVFLNHYNDTDDSFDDEVLFKTLRDIGEYK